MHVPVHGSPWCLSKTVTPHLVELQTLNAYRPYASWTGVCLPVTSFCAKCPDKRVGGGGREDSGAVCKNRGGRPGLPVPNKPCGFFGRKATFEEGKSNGTSCLYLFAY